MTLPTSNFIGLIQFVRSISQMMEKHLRIQKNDLFKIIGRNY